jgi:hypothetical protein
MAKKTTNVPAAPENASPFSSDPVDWVQVELLSRLTPAQRILLGMQAQAFARAALRGTLQRRFPDLDQSELNMRILAHFTPLRGYEK